VMKPERCQMTVRDGLDFMNFKRVYVGLNRFVDFKFDQYFVSLKCLLGLFKGFPQPSLFLSKKSDSIEKSNFY
jgi:hypothetical protein